MILVCILAIMGEDDIGETVCFSSLEIALTSTPTRGSNYHIAQVSAQATAIDADGSAVGSSPTTISAIALPDLLPGRDWVRTLL